jgi:uncharacterized damage-inducible protein DinB
MSRVPVWFKRTFEFNFPVEQYPNVCIRLRGTPARLEDLLRNCSRELLTTKPNGKWSAQEHAGHLLDLEPLWMARVDDYLNGGTVLTAADLNNSKTSNANHNSHPLEEIQAGFRKARLELVNQIEGLQPELFGRSLVHPRLKKPMRLVDHLYFVAEHDDHHLGIIWELINR